MARLKRRQPYNPAKPVHDRRAKDLLRNAEVEPMEVDDPMALDLGEKIVTLRSIHNDPLARLHAHRHISDAQYHAGRAYQQDFETAERGPKAIDPSKEYVDGGMLPEPITESQKKAVVRLNGLQPRLGQVGAILTRRVLIDGMTLEQVMAGRGLSGTLDMKGERARKYLGERFRECLDSLSLVYGFATEGACG